MLESLNWMTVKNRADIQILCLMYKCINCLTPEYLSDKLTTLSNILNHNTHSSSHNDMATVKAKKINRWKHLNILVLNLGITLIQ